MDKTVEDYLQEILNHELGHSYGIVEFAGEFVKRFDILEWNCDLKAPTLVLPEFGLAEVRMGFYFNEEDFNVSLQVDAVWRWFLMNLEFGYGAHVYRRLTPLKRPKGKIFSAGYDNKIWGKYHALLEFKSITLKQLIMVHIKTLAVGV